jgi:diguanylate cyclase (GGDEF)-like protein/PAS domain S-box-containing protein
VKLRSRRRRQAITVVGVVAERGAVAECRQPPAVEGLRAIVETAGVGLGLVDAHGVVCYVNPWLAERIGRPAEQLVGRSALDLLHPVGQAAARAGLARRRAGRADRYLVEYRCPDGGLRQLQVIGAPFRGVDGTVTGSVIVVADETARCRAEAELTRLAVTDALTGLPNRAAVYDRLGQALARRHRQQSVLAVSFLDLDGFKAVNDRFGHAAGDQVLREVAARLAAALRPADTVGRLGGDEFVVLCELPDPSETDEIANRLQAALAPAFTVHGEQVRLHASVGVAVAAADQPVEPSELLHAADLAMYRAKPAGRAARA